MPQGCRRRALPDADGDLAFHRTGRAIQRNACVCRAAGLSIVDAQMHLAVARHDRLLDLQTDLCQIGMRVPNPVHVDENDVRSTRLMLGLRSEGLKRSRTPGL